MKDDDGLNLGDFLPFVGQRRVDEALDELYNFKHLTSVLFGVFVGGFVTSVLAYVAPGPGTMAVLWLVLLALLTLATIYRHQAVNGKRK